MKHDNLRPTSGSNPGAPTHRQHEWSWPAAAVQSSVSFFVSLVILLSTALSAFALPEETRYTGAIAVENPDTGYIDDVSYGPFNIGFNFTYFGTTYTQFNPTSNGLVCLGGTSTNAFSNVSFPDPSTPPCIGAFWDDIVISAHSLAGIVMYKTIGTAPNRKLVIQFNNMGFYARSYLLGTFSVILYETSNTIQVQYRSLVDISNPRASGDSATLGLNSANGSYGALYSYDTAGKAVSERAILYTPNGSTAYTIDDSALYDGVLLEKDADNPKPTIPRLISPDNGSTVSTNPTFMWEKPSNVISYTFKISHEDSFTDSTHWTTVYDSAIADPDKTTITPADFDAAAKSALLTNGEFPAGATYYWAIFANNAAGNTWSEIHKFTTSDHPPLTAVSQTIWATLNNDMTIPLLSTGGTGTPHATIRSLPAHGQLFQYSSGGHGDQITSVPTAVTDASNRVIYFNGSTTGTNQGTFDFSMTDDSNPQPEPDATVSVHVAPAAPPYLSSPIVASVSGTELLLRFSKAMANPAGKESQFTVTVNGSTSNPATAIQLSAYTPSEMYLTLTDTLSAGDTVRVQYSDQTGTIVASDGGVLGAIDTTITVPAILEPTQFTATAVGSEQIDLTWVDNSNNETGFEIWRASAVDGTYSLVSTTAADTQSYSDPGLTTNTPYYYKVRAVSGGGQSAYTTPHGARTFVSDLSITANALQHGVISPAGTTNILLGRSQSYTITPDSGYHVAALVIDGSSVGAQLSYTFSNVTADHSIVARFEKDAATYSISASSSAGGSISPSGTITVLDQGSQTFTFLADNGFHLADVVVDGVSIGAVSDYTFSSVVTTHSIVARFVSDNASFVINASSGSNGSISPSGAVSVASGASQSFSIVAATGYHVATVLIDGVAQALAAGYTFSNVIANHTIRVAFEADAASYVITANAIGSGSISPSGVTSVVRGGTLSYSVTPDSGSHIADVLVDGVSVGALGTYAFTNTQTDHAITAHFASDSETFSIAATVDAHGNISPSGTSAVSSGGSLSYSISAETGYHLTDVQVDGVSVGAISGYLFKGVVANHTIHATIVQDAANYTISASAATNGTLSPSGSTTVTSGSDQAYTITPSSGYHVTDVLVDGVSVGAVTNYLFSLVAGNHTISATFSADSASYSITATATTGGSISPSGVRTVTSGSDVSFTMSVNSTFRLVEVLVDGVSQGAITAYTFSNVQSTHTIAATFAPLNHAPVISTGPSATPNPVLLEESVSFSAAYTDADGDTAAMTWDFGDSTTGSGASPSHTYAAPGTYTVIVSATDPSSATGTGTISVDVNPNKPVVTTTDVSSIGQTSVAAGGTVVRNRGASVTARGVCWSSNLNPTTSDTCSSDGTGNGSFVSTLSPLAPGSTYHYRAFATNTAGTAYGSDVSVKTECANGRYGSSCAECPGGASNECHGHGICSDGRAGAGTCTCDSGYYGAACQTQCPGQGFCSNNGTCSDGAGGSGSCTCLAAHFGLDCSGMCPGGGNCSNHGTCADGASGSGKCSCATSFFGLDCAGQCPGGGNCSGHGTCADGAAGNGKCTCAEGYFGDDCSKQREYCSISVDDGVVNESEWAAYPSAVSPTDDSAVLRYFWKGGANWSTVDSGNAIASTSPDAWFSVKNAKSCIGYRGTNQALFLLFQGQEAVDTYNDAASKQSYLFGYGPRASAGIPKDKLVDIVWKLMDRNGGRIFYIDLLLNYAKASNAKESRVQSVQLFEETSGQSFTDATFGTATFNPLSDRLIKDISLMGTFTPDAAARAASIKSGGVEIAVSLLDLFAEAGWTVDTKLDLQVITLERRIGASGSFAGFMPIDASPPSTVDGFSTSAALGKPKMAIRYREKKAVGVKCIAPNGLRIKEYVFRYLKYFSNPKQKPYYILQHYPKPIVMFEPNHLYRMNGQCSYTLRDGRRSEFSTSKVIRSDPQ